MEKSEIKQIIEANEQSLKEAVALGTQIAKENSSNLVSEILRKVDAGIEVAVKKHVNGHIRELDKKVTDYIVEDNKWKADAEKYRLEHIEPVIRNSENTQITFNTGKKWISNLATTITSLGIIGGAIYWFKN